MPVLLQSSQTEFEVQARQLGAGFIAKNSKTLLTQLHEYIDKEFAFGEFLFKDPDTGAVIGKAKDLVQMQEMIATIPDKAFEYHTSQNHLSKWLYSRGYSRWRRRSAGATRASSLRPRNIASASSTSSRITARCSARA